MYLKKNQIHDFLIPEILKTETILYLVSVTFAPLKDRGQLLGKLQGCGGTTLSLHSQG
jgi:hypothetical protein